jgi:sorbitol-specific phosphotransferase system component IIC
MGRLRLVGRKVLLLLLLVVVVVVVVVGERFIETVANIFSRNLVVKGKLLRVMNRPERVSAKENLD